MSRLSRVLVSISLLVVAACGGDTAGVTATTSTAALTPASLNTLSGNGQSASIGAALAQSLTVQVATSGGAPVAGAAVTFQVTSGAATLSSASAATDATGQASTQVTLGATAGAVVVVAAVQGTTLTTTFTLTAVATTTSTTTCTPTALALGEASVVTTGSICLAGGTAGAQYAVIPFNGSTNASSRATVALRASGLAAATSIASLVDGSASATSLGSSLGSSLGTSSGIAASVTPRQAFELGIRTRERTAVSAMRGVARTWYASRGAARPSGARLSVVPASATVGSLVSINANADEACENPAMRPGRVMAIGSKAIVVADTGNPANGYTSAEYASIAATFDTLVHAVDVKNFGEPTDIDGNGHVILFFTRAVNELTPKNADYYIGGFFYGRDLLPTQATSTTSAAEACASSNVGELFYLMVPDPSGAVNGNVFSKSMVTNVAIATTAHEYEHLINASRRLHVNDADDWETTWLDEGLAHVAEELTFYAQAGLAPLANLDATTIRSRTTYRTAFNQQAISNFDRLWSFLEAPNANSPYADNDSLATRGATWAFLRWAADHKTTSGDQSAVWQALVNAKTTGLTNLRGVFGTDVTAQVRDWATSLLLDDVSGVSARYAFPSWNLRSIYSALSTSGAYPLAATTLGGSATSSVSVVGGGAAYVRFGVDANATGSVAWSTTSSNVQVTVVRTR